MSSLFEAQELKGFIRVEHTARFEGIFQLLYSMQGDTLYNHSRIYPFAYLNVGRLKLFVNEDVNAGGSVKIIPVVKKFEATPTYFLHTPVAEVEDILSVIDMLTPLSKQPVKICDVSMAYVEWFLGQTKGWEKILTSKDVIYDTKIASELAGRNFSSVRNTIKRAAATGITSKLLSKETKNDAIRVFRAWKEEQGKKYFRVTIGRDERLVEEYCDKVDFENHWGYVWYVGDYPVACSYGCRSYKHSDWGVEVTGKALLADDKGNKLYGLNDFITHHMITTMRNAGINFVNDSGYATQGVKRNKYKWQPAKEIRMFDLVRK